MEKKTLYFKADNQSLVGQNVPARFASDTVSYIEAVFDLGENWSGFDAVKAVWSTDFESVCTVLDSSGTCIVPWEVLERVGDVCVNLVGSISENDNLTDRLTTYPVKAITVDANAAVCGSETSPITPSQFDQFAAAVRADADRAEAGATAAAASSSSAAASATSASGSASSASQSASGAAQSAQSASESAESASESAQSASDSAADAEEAKQAILDMTATATTLPEGSEATVNYNNGVMAFGIPKGDTGARGAKGDTGETGATPQMSIGTVETLEPDEDATATITGTAENPVLNLGLPKGETGDVSKAELASLMPLETVSGSVASFSDGSAVFDAESALITLEPIQSGSGTPSPDNVRPISGHDSASVAVAGKNLLDNTGLSDYTTWESLGSNNYAKPINLPKNTQVTISGQHTVPSGLYSYVYLQKFDGTNWQTIKSLWQANMSMMPYTFNTGDSPCRLWAYNPTASIATIDWLQIELGSTATAYEAYNGTTHTTDLGRTVYGGTLDVVSGVLTVDRAMVEFDGSEAWTNDSSGRYYVQFDDMERMADYTSSLYCDKLQTVKDHNTLLSTKGISGYVKDTTYPNRNWLYVAIDGISTVADFKAWLADNPLQVVYELITPQTYQLTPQAIALLTGDNNVWSDSGSIEVKYRANIGLYVDKKISEVSQ